MVSHPQAAPSRPRLMSIRGLSRDYALVLPGFLFSLLAFVVLVPLALISVSTLIIWVGALLLPATLRLSSRFAEFSRARARAWGASIEPVAYPEKKPGVAGLFSAMAEGRRWLDLTFETLIAFALRCFTFTVSLAWTAAALGQISYPFWGSFLPSDNISLADLLLRWITGGTGGDAASSSFALDAGVNFGVGLLFLVTLPAVMRGLALLDVTVTRVALGGGQQAAAAWGSIVSWCLALVSIAVAWPILSAIYHVPVATAMCIVVGHALALLLAARLPIVSLLLQTAAVLATLFLTLDAGTLPWPWPVTTLIVQALLTLIVTLRLGLPWAVAFWAIPQVSALVAAIALGITPIARVSLIVSASVSLGVLVIAAIVRQLASSRGALREERKASAALSAQSRELSERNRIAQELHDVVAHSMSVISVQATTAKYRLSDVEPEVEREFDSIAASSRQALSEMRSLLALLRSGEEDREAPLAPQPTASDIPALIESTRQSGASISLQMSRGTAAVVTTLGSAAGEPLAPASAAQAEQHDSTGAEEYASTSALPKATGLTVYRIVQEALSNAMRHSPGAAIAVSIIETEHEVIAEVTNVAPDLSVPHPASPGAGMGLAGVRERAAALGGSVDAGPTNDGGFSVRAALPLG